MSEFRINSYLTLKLEDDTTNIYINNEKFIQCKYLLLQLSDSTEKNLEDIDSIDDFAEMLNHSLESINNNKKNILDPKLEFWGHCSNLQAWVENDYDTRLLHSNISFPLLKKLTQVGDPLAKKKFSEEITTRLLSGHFNIIIFLLTEGYLDYLTNQEIDFILESPYHEFDFSDEALFLVIKSFILYKREKSNLANETFQEALKKTSNKAEFKYAWNEIGRAFYEQEKFDEAFEIFHYLLSIDPNYKLAWNNLGNAYKHKEDLFSKKGFKKSIPYYEKAIEIDPEFEDAWFNLASSYHHWKKYKKAIKSYNKVLELNPLNTIAWGELGSVYGEINDVELQINCYKKALEIEPNHEIYWFNLGSKYAYLGEYDKAVEALENAVKSGPDFADAWEYLGYLYFEKKEWDSGIMSFKTALKYNSELEDSWYGLAKGFIAKNCYNEAINALKMALKIYPKLKLAKKLLKFAYNERNYLEDHDNAIKDLITLEDETQKLALSKTDDFEIKWSYEEELKRNELKNNARDSIDFIEEKLREMIRRKLEEKYDFNWWEYGIPTIIREKVDLDLVKRTKINPKREYSRISLLTFSNYKEIICYKKNWDPFFKDLFIEKYNVQYIIENIRYIRNDIFHNNFYEIDFLKLKLLIEELLKFIDKN